MPYGITRPQWLKLVSSLILANPVTRFPLVATKRSTLRCWRNSSQRNLTISLPSAPNSVISCSLFPRKCHNLQIHHKANLPKLHWAWTELSNLPAFYTVGTWIKLRFMIPALLMCCDVVARLSANGRRPFVWKLCSHWLKKLATKSNCRSKKGLCVWGFYECVSIKSVDQIDFKLDRVLIKLWLLAFTLFVHRLGPCIIDVLSFKKFCLWIRTFNQMCWVNSLCPFVTNLSIVGCGNG